MDLLIQINWIGVGVAIAVVISTFVNGWLTLHVLKRVEEVHAATNGMKAELVEEVRKASFAAGVKSESDRGKL